MRRREHCSLIGSVPRIPVIALLLSFAAPCATVGVAQESAQWLNVKDFAASGSEFEATASTANGSNQITVKDVGDFKPGQGVTVSKCSPDYTLRNIHPPENAYAAKPLEGQLDMRGYDGTSGSWTVYIVEVDGADPLTFRWSDDLVRTWKAKKVPVTFDWQPLSGGTEVKFNKFDWKPGHMVTFSTRDQLTTRIEKVEGNVLTLAHPARRAVRDAVVRHCDDAAIQAVIDRAIKEKRHVFVPPGRYRLSQGLAVRNPEGLRIEGADGVNTVLDISEGHGACVRLYGGHEATVRNFQMVGHTGLGEGPGWRSFQTSSGRSYWPIALKPCQAVTIRNTERVLIENCHASKMNCEAFYCQGDSRAGGREPKEYTKSLTFLRCSATNCDGNGFNNNDMAENTSVLYCRMVDLGGCSWEGASRFVRIIGNYLRNAGPIAMGNIRSRAEHFEQLGSGQHIVANNVFERRRFYAGRPGSFMVCASAGANEVVITNNLFINFNSSGVYLSGATGDRDLPAKNGAITENIFDMTCQDEESLARTAIQVSASGTIVGDNQIYVRGQCDPKVTGIQLTEPALDLNVHDNLIRNCGCGLLTGRSRSRVGEVIDPTAFVPGPGGVPSEHRRSHCYRGWNLVWLSGNRASGQSVIESFDPESRRFKLTQPREMKIGDTFEVYPPYGANWNIHHNTISDCPSPVVLDSYGSESSLFKDNLVSRGSATGVKTAIETHGAFKIIGNHIAGFDEPGSSALATLPDPLGRTLRNLCIGNIFERCSSPIGENRKEVWEDLKANGNLFIDCGSAPK